MGVLRNEVPKWFALFLWVGAQLAIFGYFFSVYYLDPKIEYTRRLLGFAVVFARAPSTCINFNCMLILLPVCRNLLSFTRRFLCRCCLRSVRRLLDENIEFHKLSAYGICFWSAIHTMAHCYNAELFVGAQSAKNTTGSGVTPQQISTLGAGNCPLTLSTPNNNSWVNPVCVQDSYSVLEAFKIFPTLSGVIITLCLIVIVLSATEFIRRSYFEIFWFTHHLFVVFFAFLVVHGFRGVVRNQLPEPAHNTTYCLTVDFHKWGTQEEPECPLPAFQSNTPATWYWVIGPMVLYAIERLIRFVRSFQKVVITKVVKHPSKVIELQMKKKGFSMEAGQYIFIQCSAISRTEWHPFTLTSSPEEDYFSVHIRLAGDWTEAMAKAVKADEGEFQESYALPTLAVDGPFGTASEDWDQYEVDVLVGAGIGVTPFASILKHMWYTYIHSKESNEGNCKLKKVYFYWICPDTNAFEWFSDLLHHLEVQMNEKNCSDFLTHNIYLTRGWDANVARNIALHEEEEVDVVTGLHQKTHYGRPNWDQIFQKLSVDHARTRTGVFFCGPAVLSDTLHSMCNKHSSSNGARFVFNKENF